MILTVLIFKLMFEVFALIIRLAFGILPLIIQLVFWPISLIISILAPANRNNNKFLDDLAIACMFMD